MKRLLLFLLLMPLWLMAAPPPPYRPNFFDTNVNPRVIVAAGTNVTVQYTTTGTDVRTYTVNSSGGGGTGQTNWDYTAITNAPWQWGSQNLTNWSQLSTNVLGAITNLNGGDTNQVYTQIGWSGNPTITNLTSQTIYSTGIVQRFEAGSTNTLVVTNGGIGVNTDTPIIGSITINRPSNGTGLSITNANTSGVILSRYNSTAPPGFALQKYGATLSPTSPVANSELLGRYQANAADGSQIQVAGHCTFVTAPTNAGAITSSNLPTELLIYLNPGGGTNNVLERARFTYDGRLGIGTGTPNDTLAVMGGITASNTITGTNGFVDGSGTIGSLVAYGAGNRLVATNVDYLTNGYPWTNLTVALAGAVTNGYPWTNIYSPGISGGSTNQVYTQTGWSGYPQVTNLSLITNGLGTAIVPTLWLTNPTPAALGAQQNSPALMLGGQGWRSGNSTTMPVQAGILCEPVQGSSANPLAQLYFIASVAGAAPVIMGWMKSDYTLTMQGGISAGGNIGTSSGTVSCEAASAFTVGTRSRIYSPADQDLRLTDSTGLLFNRLYFGVANALWPALKVESTNAPTLSIRTGADANYASLVASNVTAVGTMFTANMIVTNNLTLNGTLTVSNITGNFVHSLYATNGYTVCTTAKDVYLVNAYTNPMFVLPDATTVKGQEFIFSTTNRGAFFIVTNATGAQPVADGTSLSYTNTDNGLKVVRFISDGAAWWLSSKGRVTLPCASWSCSTNTTFANVTNSITLNTVEMNNLSGIYLDNSAWYTAGVGSRMWVTNPGVYMLTFSAVWSKVGGGAANGDIWLRQNGTDIPRTMTLQTIQNSSTTNVMTVNFMLPVTGVTYFDLQGASPDGSAQLQAMPAITSPFNRPACPSIIVTLNKTSD